MIASFDLLPFFKFKWKYPSTTTLFLYMNHQKNNRNENTLNSYFIYIAIRSVSIIFLVKFTRDSNILNNTNQNDSVF